MFRLNKNEKIIFWASIAVKLVFFVFIGSIFGWHQPFSQIQSDGYLPRAENIFYHHVFSSDATPPYRLESMSTPGYPLFLATTAVPFGTVIFALLIQIFLVSYAAVLFFASLKGLLPFKAAFLGGVIFAIEPWNAYSANSVLSESLFLFFLILGWYLAKLAYQNLNPRDFFFAGLSLGLAAFLRPIGLYLLPLGALWLLILLFKKIGARKMIFYAGLFLVGGYLIIGAWSLRNLKELGTYSFATKGPHTLYFYNVEQLLVFEKHISAGEADEFLYDRAKKDFPDLRSKEELNDVKYGPYLTHESLAIISQYKKDYLKLQILSMGTFFFSDGYRLLASELGVHLGALPNITYLIFHHEFQTLFLYLKSDALTAILFFTGLVFWGLCSILAFLSFPLAFLRRDSRAAKMTILILLSIIFYFAVLTGPVAQARYRVPITPFLFVLAAYSVIKLKENRHQVESDNILYYPN
ncbi:MAG: hypothetical protein HY220_00420 [Candidatus Sungbacteria bacterium]|uniref:Glycosyltransferase RgtA/B/C/D-like domain-containing protein n=1 Tax=Candidatus Sungiibacteriota bacterium TaxID=2750080 RepID=A0A9D6QTI5_9BACT|nr:hypothetical protein [Candidatus Sungbacteria bacterium]